MSTVAAQQHVTYTPLGGSRALFESRDGEVVITGPAGTGKSRACVEKAFALANLHPRSRILFTRRDRKSLTESTLRLFEQVVVPPGSPWLQGADRLHRARYSLPNGSEVHCIGLDDAQKLMSSEFDWIYAAEAIELHEADWELLISRLRGTGLRDRQSGKPWTQVVGCCNPSFPNHWILQRARAGRLTLLDSAFEDNPSIDPEYIAKLASLSGHRRSRLYEGKWSSPEGAVFDEWCEDRHVVPRRPLPEHWPRLRSCDFGYRHPSVCQWWALSDTGQMILYREVVRTGLIADDFARLVRDYSRGETFAGTMVDHQCQERLALERHGIATAAANKAILPGIQELQSRMRPGNDGEPRLVVFADALVSRDAAMDAKKLPIGLIEEAPNYEWSSPKPGQILKELPIDKDNHSIDAARYAAMALRAVVWLRDQPLPEVIIRRPLDQSKLGKGVRTGWGRERSSIWR